MVLEELPLADFGNRIPNLTAEITFRRTPSQPYQILDLVTLAEGGMLDGYQLNELAVDWRRGKGWLLTSSSDPVQAGLRRFDLATMREDRQAPLSEICTGSPASFPSTLFCGSDGALYFVVGTSNSRPIIRVEPDSLREVARFGVPGGGLVNTTTSFVATSFMGLVSAYGPDGRVDFLITGSVFADLGLLHAPDLAYVWGAGQHAERGTIRGCVGGRVELGTGEGFVIASGDGAGHTILDLYRLTVSAVASYDAATGQTLGVELEKVASLLPADIQPSATASRGRPGPLSTTRPTTA